MVKTRRIKTDVLVIGGGDAGLFAAIYASEQDVDVVLVDKAYAGKSGASIMASGWFNLYDPDKHDWNMLMAGINAMGDQLNDRNWSATVMKESLGVYQDLRRFGCQFPISEDEDPDVWYAQHMNVSERRGGGHDTETANGGAPFSFIPLQHRGIPPYLRKEADRRERIRIIDRMNVTELLKSGDAVAGCIGFGVESGISYVIEAKVTIMCAGNNYFRPPGYHTSSVTGDADAMAYRAGAKISGKEFEDGHFTIAKDPQWKGNGELYPAFAHFVNAEGKRVPVYGMDLGMTKEVHAGRGPCYWDWDAAEWDDTQALLNYKKKRGNPVETERVGLWPQDGGEIPMVGGHAAGGCEEQMSGIWPKEGVYDGETDIPRLYAAGDCLYTRAWGALINGAPWGIMPACAEGKLAGRSAGALAKTLDYLPVDEDYIKDLNEAQFVPLNRVGGFDSRWVDQLLQGTMVPYYVCQIKHADRLKAALTQVEFFRDVMVPKLKAHDFHELKMAHETKNMVLNAEMILRSDLAREESRGRMHYREDFPEKDPNWTKWIQLYEKDGKMELGTVAVPEEWL